MGQGAYSYTFGMAQGARRETPFSLLPKLLGGTRKVNPSELILLRTEIRASIKTSPVSLPFLDLSHDDIADK